MTKKRFNSICERVTDRIIGFLDAGIIPWQKPWSGGSHNAPRSASTGKIYRGMNLALLSCAGHESPWWMTFGQAKKLGGAVKKGEKAFPIHYWKFNPKRECKHCLGVGCDTCGGTGTYRPMPNLFSFNVFNASQVDGLDEKYYGSLEKPADVNEFTPIEAAEKICDEYPDSPATFHDQQDRAYYSPSSDEIHLVTREQFVSDDEYYSVRFHEMVHSTGHKSRLDRDGITGSNFFGSHGYSKEELVAEMGSTFLCGIAGIDKDEIVQNSAAYIQSWKKALTENTDWLVWAGSRAAKSTDHILGTEYTKEKK
jgi:antirestriction protein ArdC